MIQVKETPVLWSTFMINMILIIKPVFL